MFGLGVSSKHQVQCKMIEIIMINFTNNAKAMYEVMSRIMYYMYLSVLIDGLQHKVQQGVRNKFLSTLQPIPPPLFTQQRHFVLEFT